MPDENQNKATTPASGEPGGRTDGDDLGKRLESLNARLGQHKAAETEAKEADNRNNKAGLAMAFRLSSEFVAGSVVGAVIGYAVDTIFGTSPWGMIIFFMLGFLAAILNVLRASGKVAQSQLHLHKVREFTDKQSPGEESK